MDSFVLQTSDSDIQNGEFLGRLGFAANEADTGDARAISAVVSAMAEAPFTSTSNPTSIVFATAFDGDATNKLRITSSGNFLPFVSGIYDIGSGTLPFRKVFTDKLRVADYNFPLEDGDNGDVIATDGAGQLSFIPVTSATDKFIDSLDFNTSTNVLTIGRSDGVDFTETINAGGGTIDGTGTASYVAKWVDSDTLTSGIIYDNGSQVGIGTDNPTELLAVSGDAQINKIQIGSQAYSIGSHTQGITHADYDDNQSYMIISDGNNTYTSCHHLSGFNYMRGPRNSASYQVAVGNNYMWIGTNSFERMTVGSTETVFNQDASGVDFRVEGMSDPNLLRVDASEDMVGIGHAHPRTKLHVRSSTGEGTILSQTDDDTSWAGFLIRDDEDVNVGSFQFGNSDVLSPNYTHLRDVLFAGSRESGVPFHIYQGRDLFDDGTANLAFRENNQRIILDTDGYTRLTAASGKYVHVSGVNFAIGDEGTSLNGAHRVPLSISPTGYAVTATPTAAEQTNKIRVYDREGNGIAGFGVSTSSFNIATSGLIHQRFWTNSNERMRITHDGKVGIRTTTPSSTLHIAGNVKIEEQFFCDLDFNANLYNHQAKLRLFSHPMGSESLFQMIGVDSSTELTFHTNNTERMRVTAAGNLGIGTTIPATLLHIRKDSTYNSENTYALKISDGNDPETHGLLLGADSANDGAFIQAVDPGTSWGRDLYLQRMGGDVYVGNINNKLSCGSAFSSNEKLVVNGNISASGTRPIEIRSDSHGIRKKGDAGGWAFSWDAVGNNCTVYPGFGFYGSNDTLIKYFIGNAYNDPDISIYPDRTIGIGADPVSYSKLHVFNTNNGPFYSQIIGGYNNGTALLTNAATDTNASNINGFYSYIYPTSTTEVDNYFHFRATPIESSSTGKIDVQNGFYANLVNENGIDPSVNTRNYSFRSATPSGLQDQNIAFYAAGTAKSVFNGPVGVGTTYTSNAKLTVADGANTRIAIDTGNNLADSEIGIDFIDRHNASSQGDEGQIGAFVRSQRQGNGGSFDLILGTVHGSILSADADEKVRITSDGIVGVGSTTQGVDPNTVGADVGIHIASNNFPEVHFTNDTTGHASTSGANIQLNSNKLITTNRHPSSYIQFYTFDAASVTKQRMSLGPSEVSINDIQDNIDFRVESDSHSHLLFTDASTDTVNIGSTNDSYSKLYLVDTQTDKNVSATSPTSRGISIFKNDYTTITSTQYAQGINVRTEKHVSNGITDSGYVMAGNFVALHDSGGTINEVVGVRSNSGGYYDHSGVITNLISFKAVPVNLGTGTITNSYGLYLGSNPTSTVSYGIYQGGTNDTNYFGGDVGLGLTNPSEKLHIHGGNIKQSQVAGVGAGIGKADDGVHILYPGGGTYGGTSPVTVTGYIKIEVPAASSSTMMAFDLDIYEYENNVLGRAAKFRIAGYEYSSNQWHRTQVIMDGDGPTDHKYKVSFGRDTNNRKAIYISQYSDGKDGVDQEASSLWRYPKVSISNVFCGHNSVPYSEWIDNWDVGIVAAADIESVYASHVVARSLKLYESSYDLASLTINSAFTFPTSDGTVDQVLKTDGAGNLRWDADLAGSGGNNIVRGTVSATNGQTSFSVGGGYTVGAIDVYLNGVKLINGTDFTATDTSAPYNIVLTSAAQSGDTLEYMAFDRATTAGTLQDTGDTMTGNLTVNADLIVTGYKETHTDNGNTGTAQTIDISDSTVQTYTLNGNCTFTMPTVEAGRSFTMLLKTGAGSFVATFTNVKFPKNTAPTITTDPNRMDLITFTCDGTSWYGNAIQDYYV